MEICAENIPLAEKRPDKVSGKNLFNAPLWLILFVFLLLLIQEKVVWADVSIEEHMRKLVSEAGPVPDAIINPLQPLTNDIGAVEKLSRFWKEQIMGFRITYSTARGKACHANQRVLTGAVEMYNMDKGNTMTRLVPADAFDTASPLVTGMYLKSPINRPETKCEYMSYGDLTGPGILYCSQHGTIPDYRAALIKVTGVKPNSAGSEERLQIAFAGLLVFLSLSAIMLLLLLFKKRRPESQEE